MMSPEQVASNFGLSVATLADWRSQQAGPQYIKTGRNIWYPEEFVDSWAESQIRTTRNGIKEKGREVALPVQTRRKAVRRNNRFGRHVTKQEKRDQIEGTVKSASAKGIELAEYPGRFFHFSSVGSSMADLTAEMLGRSTQH